MSNYIFISWSGKRSELLSEALADFLRAMFPNKESDIFISTRAIRGGHNWNVRLNEALRESHFGIICVTPENKTAPWPLFEAGALAMQAGEMSVCPFLYELSPSELGKPLEQFNALTATRSGASRLVEAVNAILKDKRYEQHILHALFLANWPKFEAAISAIPSLNSDFSLLAAEIQHALPHVISLTRDNPSFRSNDYFAQVICDTLLRLKRSLEKVDSAFDVPVTLYPAYLVSLLDKHGCKVKVNAVAVVDATERFWPQREGERIMRATPTESSRVFVFHEPEHLKANIAWVARHARLYNVSIASYPSLAILGQDYLKDFSIIEGESEPLLAYYGETVVDKQSGLPLKMIRFSTDRGEISSHQNAFSTMLNHSTKIHTNVSPAGAKPDPDAVTVNPEDEESVDKLADIVFGRTGRSFEKKQVEMSSYIDVLEYDLHEEGHSYYIEMMASMIGLSHLDKESGGAPRQVLEFGAGTGLFTKRLAQLPNLDLVAVELDWACYHILRLRLEASRGEMERRGSKFKAQNKDCRSFNPPGRFRYIFSSFADHHIFPADKPRYFANVKRNLLDSGLFIVGDEFLPEYDESSKEERERALKTYHNHIIDLANLNGHHELAQLERGALDSGLKEIGDFKMSCTQYEKAAKKSGLTLVHKIKIGPADMDDVGGVYVYAFKK